MNDRVRDVIAVVASVLDIPAGDIGADGSMEQLSEWDSIAQLNICMVFAERFNVSMDMVAIAEATSVPKLVALLR